MSNNFNRRHQHHASNSNNANSSSSSISNNNDFNNNNRSNNNKSITTTSTSTDPNLHNNDNEHSMNQSSSTTSSSSSSSFGLLSSLSSLWKVMIFSIIVWLFMDSFILLLAGLAASFGVGGLALLQQQQRSHSSRSSRNLLYQYHTYLPILSNQDIDDMETLQPLETAGFYYPNNTTNQNLSSVVRNFIIAFRSYIRGSNIGQQQQQQRNQHHHNHEQQQQQQQSLGIGRDGGVV